MARTGVKARQMMSLARMADMTALTNMPANRNSLGRPQKAAMAWAVRV
jgi:hypothetical protein